MTFSTQFRVKLDTVSVEKGYSSDMIYPEWSSYSLIYFLLSIVSTHRCWNNILYKSLLSLTAHRYFKIRDGLHLHCACFYYQHDVVIFRPPLSLTLTFSDECYISGGHFGHWDFARGYSSVASNNIDIVGLWALRQRNEGKLMQI